MSIGGTTSAGEKLLNLEPAAAAGASAEAEVLTLPEIHQMYDVWNVFHYSYQNCTKISPSFFNSTILI